MYNFFLKKDQAWKKRREWGLKWEAWFFLTAAAARHKLAVEYARLYSNAEAARAARKESVQRLVD